MNALQELRVRAEILHRHAQAGDAQALRRLGRVVDRETAIRRGECLATLARELGFASWPEAKQILEGLPGANYGTLLYPTRGTGILNLWFKDVEEARAVRRSRNGWLLAYRHQFLVVAREFIEELGLNPDDQRWLAIDFDWTALRHSTERAEFYNTLVSRLPMEGGSLRRP